MSGGAKLGIFITVVIAFVVGVYAIKSTVQTVNAVKISNSPTVTFGMLMDTRVEDKVRVRKHGKNSHYQEKTALVYYVVEGKSYEKTMTVDMNKQSGDTLELYYHVDDPETVYKEVPGFFTLLIDVIVTLVLYALTVGAILVMRKIYHSQSGGSALSMDRIMREARLRQMQADSIKAQGVQTRTFYGSDVQDNQPKTTAEKKYGTDSSDYKEPWE